jgi:hypothetical protein
MEARWFDPRICGRQEVGAFTRIPYVHASRTSTHPVRPRIPYIHASRNTDDDVTQTTTWQGEAGRAGAATGTGTYRVGMTHPYTHTPYPATPHEGM